MKSALGHYPVDVVESGTSPRRNRVRCEIGEDVQLDANGLQNYCFARRDERVYDALVVAAAVEFCDRTNRRPLTRWGRQFELRVPVHDPSLWRSASTALSNAVSLLTGDRWNFEFIARAATAPVDHQAHFVMPTGNPDVVIPYSDGVDSFAVAKIMKHKYGCNILRVRLGLKCLNEGSSRDCPSPFAFVPYRVTCKSKRADETSARSRGFKFAMLSGVAAYMSGARKVIMPESGQGALGSSLVPVGQVYEDYRNHPLFTDLMTALILRLLDYEVRFTYPRLWYTKAETLREFMACCSDDPNWARTRTCWQNQRHVSVQGRRRQCGVCAACMLRRMSVHAAGLTESRQSYVWEDLTEARYEDGAAALYRGNRGPNCAMHEYAIAGTLHLDNLASVLRTHANQASLSRQVSGLSRSLGLTEGETETRLYRLRRQHEEEWRNFVDSLGPKSFVTQWI